MKMDAVNKVIAKIEFPRSVDGFMKSGLENQLIIGGIAGMVYLRHLSNVYLFIFFYMYFP